MASSNQKFPKGSEWRKWDLHVHTPYSLDEGFTGATSDDKWENFIKDLEALPEEFQVIGISNELIRQIGEANRKIDNARELSLLHNLEANEYRKIKEDNGSTIARLEMRLNEVNVQKSTQVNIKKLAQMAVNALCEVDKLYDIASIEEKRYIVGILFPEKMTYAEGVCRTGKLNRAAELIYL